MITFTFPKNIEEIQVVKDLKQIKNRLTHEKLTTFEYQTQTQVIYSFHSDRHGRYIAASCNRCKARLNFVRQTNQNGEYQYKLSSFKNKHMHLQKNKQMKTQKIVKKIKEMDQIGINVTKKFITEKFDCSGPTYYKARRILDGIQQNKTFLDLVAFLTQLKYQFRYQPYQQDVNDSLPEILLIISPEMKKLYQMCGKCLCFDTIYNLCKDRPKFKIDQQIRSYNMNPVNDRKKRVRQFVLTTIYGLNGFQKIVVFGFAIVLDESAETTQKILKTFFKSQDTINTETIITDAGAEIESGINALVRDNIVQCEHLHDAHHILKNVNIKGRSKRTLLSQIYRSQSQCQYQQKFQELKQVATLDELAKIEKLMPKTGRFCFSQVPKTFIHGRLSSSPYQILNDLIKSKIKNAENYVPMVQKICKIFQITNTKSHVIENDRVLFKQILGLEFLELCRKSLRKKIFRLIVEQVNRSHQNTVTVDNSGFHVEYTVRNSKFKEHCKVKQDHILICDCGYRQKTLLPCSHIISIAILRGRQIFNQVDKFYKQELQIFIEKQTSKPDPAKATERNKLK